MITETMIESRKRVDGRLVVISDDERYKRLARMERRNSKAIKHQKRFTKYVSIEQQLEKSVANGVRRRALRRRYASNYA